MTLTAVQDEMDRLDAKWGTGRSLPDVDPFAAKLGVNPVEFHFTTVHSAADGQLACDTAAHFGSVAWAHILVEEVAEAIEETDPARRIVELVQVAAVCMQWVKDLEGK